ncbi:hypothetical protein [Pusillibacter faecalis]|nr:hypothetical protein [Pusillibacter faecalis]
MAVVFAAAVVAFMAMPTAASAVWVCGVQVQKIDFDGAFLRSQRFHVI